MKKFKRRAYRKFRRGKRKGRYNRRRGRGSWDRPQRRRRRQKKFGRDFFRKTWMINDMVDAYFKKKGGKKKRGRKALSTATVDAQKEDATTKELHKHTGDQITCF